MLGFDVCPLNRLAVPHSYDLEFMFTVWFHTNIVSYCFLKRTCKIRHISLYTLVGSGKQK